MQWRLPVVLILLAGLVSLAPLAQASLPDPTWTGGLYDGDDGDDVLAAVSTDSVLESPLLVDPNAVLIVTEFLAVADAARVTPPTSPTFQVRAPPIPVSRSNAV